MPEEMVLFGPREKVEPVIFDAIDADLISKLAFTMKGSSGPSKFDADDWKRIIATKIYGNEGKELCEAIAHMTRQLCTEDTSDPESISAALACRLIPLVKNPGLRPIGIGEVLRRLIGKAVTRVLRSDIELSAGSLQLCAGQKGGCEVAIHSMVDIFDNDDTHGIIQVDANNAFNTINRKALLNNIGILCPTLFVFTVNCYKVPARLFVTGGAEIESKEGSTQGDPIAGSIYGIGITPLLDIIATDDKSVRHVAFADDITGAGKLAALKQWWNLIIDYGKYLGYTANPGKSWLIVKPQYHMQAEIIFRGSGIQITTEGNKQLGAVVGSNEFKKRFVASKIEQWTSEVRVLTDIARYEPHAAFAAFTHGLKHRYTFLMRTVPDISNEFELLDSAIDVFIETLLRGYRFSAEERELFALPVKMGGLGIIIPSKLCEIQYSNSRTVTEELIEHVTEQNANGLIDAERTKKVISKIKSEKLARHQSILESLSLPDGKKKVLEAVNEVGASAWLSAIPIKVHGFYLDKKSFWDAIRLRYGIALERLPSNCVCGNTFNVEHALSCPKGGFVSIRHNEVRDITAEFLAETCKDVQVEPVLTPVTGELLPSSSITGDEARMDISARGFWIRGSKAFLDVSVYNPMAKRYSTQSISAAHKRNENEKKKSYNQRMQQIEHYTFTPLVFSSFDGMAHECKAFYQRLCTNLQTREGKDFW